MARIRSLLPLLLVALCASAYAVDEDTPRVDDLETNQTAIFNAIARQGQSINTLKVTVLTLSNLTTDITLRINDIHAAIVALQATDGDHAAAIATLTAAQASLQATVTALQAQVATLLGAG